MNKIKSYYFTEYKTIRNILTLFIAFGCMYVGYLTADGKSISGEEGVVLDCIQFEFWRLLKPIDLLVHGCTIDHMPLYHLVSKLIFNLFGFSLYPLRYTSIAITTFTVVLLFRWMSTKKSYGSLMLGLLVAYFFLSSNFTIKHLSFIRMYSLYALMSLLSFICFENFFKHKDNRSLLLLCLINFFGFFTYAIHILISIVQIPFLVKNIKGNQQKRGLQVYLLILGIYAAVKAYPLLTWRVFERSKDTEAALSIINIKNDFLFPWSGELAATPTFYLFCSFLLIAVILLVFKIAKEQSESDRYFACLLFFTLVSAAVLRYGLDLREVSYRYFIYLGFIPFYIAKRLSHKKKYLILFIFVFAGLVHDRKLDLKINIWKNSPIELAELIKFTSSRVEELNREGVISDSYTYFRYYIKAVHDYELHKPIAAPKLTFNQNFKAPDMGWYFVFLSRSTSDFLAKQKNKFKVLEEYKFPTLFDEGNDVLVLKLEKISP